MGLTLNASAQRLDASTARGSAKKIDRIVFAMDIKF
jgi:hypothetical protein